MSQRFAGQVNDPLRVRFLHGRTLGMLALLLVGEVLPYWELALLAWGLALFSWEALSLIQQLTTWGEAWLARETLLSNSGVLLSAWEVLSLVECLTACLPA